MEVEDVEVVPALADADAVESSDDEHDAAASARPPQSELALLRERRYEGFEAKFPQLAKYPQRLPDNKLKKWFAKSYEAHATEFRDLCTKTGFLRDDDVHVALYGNFGVASCKWCIKDVVFNPIELLKAYSKKNIYSTHALSEK
jgi:hypothetical protein